MCSVFIFCFVSFASAKSGDEYLWIENTNLPHSYGFSSPVITGDSIYFSSFDYLVDKGWFGRLQKFRLTQQGVILDKDSERAFDCNGHIISSARSFWDISDTNNTANLMLKNKGSRKIFTNTEQGKESRLIALSEEQQSNIPKILADSMHNKPVVLDYGSLHSKHDRRILLATNAGVLHLFSDNLNVLDESWAFIPAEFLSRQSANIMTKQYGLDGDLTIFHDDVDHDGIIEAAEGERLWLFFGLRQGGRSYYALDLTNPDHPTFKWKISSSDGNRDFSLLGETWSVPQIAHISAKAPSSPVIIVGGGNSVSGSDIPEKTNISGRAIYIVDADTGQKLFSVSPDHDSIVNLQAPLEYPIPASVAVLDSDHDGFDDRLYVGDLGGNVWRLDMNGEFSQWQISRLATLSMSSAAKPLRFFGQPLIVRSLLRVSSDQYSSVDVPADWVLLGSGNRDELLAPSSNGYFALPDRQVIPYAESENIPDPLTYEDLHSVFSKKSNSSPSGVFTQGWYVDVAQEQIFGNGYVAAGKVWFTSFDVAAKNGADSIGTTRLYQFDLVTGSYPEKQPVVGQLSDHLLENLGLAYQGNYQQLWMTGVPLLPEKNAECSLVGTLISDALQPRKIAEYFSER